MPPIPALTGFRLVAALSVAIGHGLMYFFNTRVDEIPILSFAILPTGFGMACFFVLSGFVIQYNYGRSVAHGGKAALFAFTLARFARLYPLFLLLFGMEILLGGFVRKYLNGWPVERHAWEALPFHLLFTQSWFYSLWDGYSPVYQFGDVGQVSWSIATEWGFYLAFPLICRGLARCGDRMLHALLLAVPALGLGVALLCSIGLDGINAFALRHYGPQAMFIFDVAGGAHATQDSFLRWIYYFSPWSRVIEFAFGCVLAEAWIRRAAVTRGWHRPALRGAMVFAVAMVAALFTPLRLWPWPVLGWMLIAAFGFAVPVAVMIWRMLRGGVLARLFGSRIAVAGGEASFGIYLLHLPVFKAIGSGPLALETEAVLRHGAALLLGLGVTIVLALVAHAAVEQPARRWIRARFAPGGQPRPGAMRWGGIGLGGAVALTVVVAAIPLWRGANAQQAEGISLVAASYGANCRAADVTQPLRAACNGRASCDYRVDVAVLGDPAPRCAKGFSAAWVCRGESRMRQLSLPPEAGLGSVAALRCGPG